MTNNIHSSISKIKTPFDRDQSNATKTEDFESYFDVEKFKEKLHQITQENGQTLLLATDVKHADMSKDRSFTSLGEPSHARAASKGNTPGFSSKGSP